MFIPKIWIVFFTYFVATDGFILDWFLTKDHKTVKPEPETGMTAEELITSKGLPGESHTVLTSDGYLLGVQRIRRNDAPAVFLQHGLLDSSIGWLVNQRHQSLAYLLYDAGYDVWLGNARGNTYSRKHVKYSTNQEQFWDFSFDEIAKYDLPAMLEYTLNATQRSNIYYIGHSQGSLIAFIQLSQNKNLANKVKMFFGLGPVTTLRYVTSPIAKLVSSLDLKTLFGMKEFLPKNKVVETLGHSLCRSHIRSLCSNILFIIGGDFAEGNLNMTRLPVYVSHTPAGTSVKNLLHFGQLINSGQFQAYNYKSLSKNIEKYGQSAPPSYDIGKIETPIVLYSGEKDPLADPRDIASWTPKLKNLREHRVYKGWGHLDFTWGVKCYQNLYADIIEKMNSEEKKAPTH